MHRAKYCASGIHAFSALRSSTLTFVQLDAPRLPRMIDQRRLLAAIDLAGGAFAALGQSVKDPVATDAQSVVNLNWRGVGNADALDSTRARKGF